MALTLGDNFSYQGAKPLDARLNYSTVAAMKAVADATMYNGCMGYCAETEKTYQWKSTNTVDETLGKWREFQAGGGGATYEAGDGIDISEENEISAHVMTEGDMDDVVTPLPSISAKMPVLFDESETERVVGWYKYADGTKKPMYEKCIFYTIPQHTSTNREWITIIPSDKMPSNIEECYIKYCTIDRFAFGFLNITGSAFSFLYDITYSKADNLIMGLHYGHTWLSDDPCPAVVIIQYTKTTDTPE